MLALTREHCLKRDLIPKSHLRLGKYDNYAMVKEVTFTNLYVVLNGPPVPNRPAPLFPAAQTVPLAVKQRVNSHL